MNISYESTDEKRLHALSPKEKAVEMGKFLGSVEQVDEVILLGSAVESPTPRDIDLCVIIRDNPNVNEKEKVEEVIHSLGFQIGTNANQIHIMIYTQDDLSRMKKSPTFAELETNIRNGVILFKRTLDDRIRH
ncbi:MAG: hypothetical protein ABI758_04565 [Candidatus Woesebacteria bacterium]